MARGSADVGFNNLPGKSSWTEQPEQSVITFYVCMCTRVCVCGCSMQEVGNRQTMLIMMGNACCVVVAVADAAAAAAREMQLITYADGSHVGRTACRNPGN